MHDPQITEKVIYVYICLQICNIYIVYNLKIFSTGHCKQNKQNRAHFRLQQCVNVNCILCMWQLESYIISLTVY